MHLGAASALSRREVERLIRCEGFAAYQVLTNSECASGIAGSEGAGAKVRVREENNPDRQLRSPNGRRVGLTRSGRHDS